MREILALCIRCGTLKPFVSEICKACGFEPQSDEDIAKSFLLSTHFDAGDDVFGKSNDELLAISNQIRRGDYEFDSDEVQRHLAIYRDVKETTWGILILDLVKWMGPPFLVLAAALGLIWLYK